MGGNLPALDERVTDHEQGRTAGVQRGIDLGENGVVGHKFQRKSEVRNQNQEVKTS
jgi:hypothetical protein